MGSGEGAKFAKGRGKRRSRRADAFPSMALGLTGAGSRRNGLWDLESAWLFRFAAIKNPAKTNTRRRKNPANPVNPDSDEMPARTSPFPIIANPAKTNMDARPPLEES